MIKENFSVFENKISQLGKKFSIVKDKNGTQHTFPIWLTEGSIDLDYEISATGKYKFDISKFNICPSKVGETTSVRIIRIEQKILENEFKKKVFLVDYDRSIKEINFLNWQYCNNFKIPRHLELFTYLDRNQKHKFIQKLTPENRHPYFEVGKEYKLKFVCYLSGKSENGSLQLTDEFGGIYYVDAFYNQKFNDLEGKMVKCIFKGYDKYSNVSLVQAERKFLTYKDVFKKEKPLIDNVKRHLENINEYDEFLLQYNNKDNRWLLSMVKVLNKGIDTLIENKNYELANHTILIFLLLEEYIITSKYLPLFPQRSEDISRIATYQLNYYRTLLKPLETLANFTAEKYIQSCVENIHSPLGNIDEKLSNLEQICITLRLSNLPYFGTEFLVNIIETLHDFLHQDISEKYRTKFSIHIKSIIHPLEKSLFKNTFFNSKSKNTFYHNNKDLIKYFNLCNLLLHLADKVESKEKLIWYAKSFRCVSLYNYVEKKSINITQALIDILLRNCDFKLLPLQYFSSLSYESFPFLELPKIKKNTLEWEQLKLLYSKQEFLETEVIGQDIFGYYVSYNNFKGYVSSEFMREYEAAYFYFYNKTNKPKFAILSVDDFSQAFLVKYERSKEELNRLQNLKTGEVVKGIVMTIVKSGAQILCRDVPSFTHKTELDWGPVSFVEDILTIGKEYEFKVIDSTDNSGNYLSLKQTFIDPWKTMQRNLDKTFDAIFLRKIELNYLNDFHRLNIDFEKSDIIQTDCPRCSNMKHIKDTLTIDTIKKSWFCSTPGCHFQGEEILLFRVVSKKFNTCIPLSEISEIEKSFVDKELQRGDRIKLILQSFDLSTRFSYSIFDSTEVYNKENIGIDYKGSKEDAIIAELAKTYEDLASLTSDALQEIEFLQWAKHYYTIVGDSKSYFYHIYILYLELIHEMKGFSNSDGLDKLSNFKKRITNLLANKEDLDVTIEIYKEINNHLQIFKYFLFLDDISFETNLFLLNENFNPSILNSTVKNFASIILSHNLLLSHKPNNLSHLYTQTFSYLYSTLQEGKLNEINPLIETDDLVNEFENEKRNDLLKLLHEGEGRNIEFKSSLFTPILSREMILLIENFDERIKLANENKDSEKAKQLKLEKAGRCRIATENDIKHSAIKEIAAFANTDGGYLIIGVNDHKEIIGLDEDFKKMNKENKQDEFLTKFDDLIKEYLGENIQQLLAHKFIKVKDKIVFLLTIKPNSNKKDPVLLRKNYDGKPESEFYTRAQGSVRKLSTLEIITYMNSFII